MATDRLDVLLEEFLYVVKSDGSSESIVRGAELLYQEGVGEDGLLRTVETELGTSKRDTVAEILHNYEPGESEQAVGVGGWLAFFCASLILFFPLSNSLTLYQAFSKTSFVEILSHEQGVSVGVWVLSVVFLVMYSVVAGVLLIQLKPYAVTFAKSYLITYLIISSGLPLFLYMIAPPTQGVSADYSLSMQSIASPLIYFTIWYLYLSTSSRVKATFYNGSEVE